MTERIEPDQRVTVVIVHYGDDALAERCIDSIEASAGVRAGTVLVDNSPRQSERLRRRLEGRGTYLHYPENPGFAAGANAGLRCALLGEEPGVLALLNADVRLGRRCLRRLADGLRDHAGAGIVGPALFAASRPRRYWNLGSTLRWPAGKPGSRRHGSPHEPGLRGPIEVDYICGAALAVAPGLLRTVGFLNEDYYLYYEDAEFSCRVRQHGYRVLLLPAARAWHQGGAAFHAARTPALYYRTRNRLLFSARWNPQPLRGRWCRSVFASRALGRAVRSFVAGRRPEARTLCQAVLDYYRGHVGRAPQHCAPSASREIRIPGKTGSADYHRENCDRTG